MPVDKSVAKALFFACSALESCKNNNPETFDFTMVSGSVGLVGLEPMSSIRHCRPVACDKHRPPGSVSHWAFSHLYPPLAAAGCGPSTMSTMLQQIIPALCLRCFSLTAHRILNKTSKRSGRGDYAPAGIPSYCAVKFSVMA